MTLVRHPSHKSICVAKSTSANASLSRRMRYRQPLLAPHLSHLSIIASHLSCVLIACALPRSVPGGIRRAIGHLASDRGVSRLKAALALNYAPNPIHDNSDKSHDSRPADQPYKPVWIVSLCHVRDSLGPQILQLTHLGSIQIPAVLERCDTLFNHRRLLCCLLVMVPVAIVEAHGPLVYPHLSPRGLLRCRLPQPQRRNSPGNRLEESSSVHNAPFGSTNSA